MESSSGSTVVLDEEWGAQWEGRVFRITPARESAGLHILPASFFASWVSFFPHLYIPYGRKPGVVGKSWDALIFEEYHNLN